MGCRIKKSPRKRQSLQLLALESRITPTTLHTYRLAIAATGEFTALFGGTVAGAKDAIKNAVDRVNAIYLEEMSIQFTLVPNNDNLIYTNPATDPYTSGNTKSLVIENQANVDAVIGNSNYDVAQVFDGTDSGGLATGLAGQAATKAQGTSTSNTANSDSFYTRVFAHELGHQLSASHVFNSSMAAIADQWNGLTAVEPGSGSTIMSYAGGGPLGTDNLQANVDPYFNVQSLVQMDQYINNNIPNVGTKTTIANTSPNVVSVPTQIRIPTNTPFEIHAKFEDYDFDPITYSFEESDTGPAQHLGDPDNGSSPLFRSFPPTYEEVRYFPRLDRLVANSPSPGETLPTLARNMHFNLTARDHHYDGVGSYSGYFTVHNMLAIVVDTAAPFRVTGLDTPGTSLAANSAQTITWDVAGTAGAGINTTFVEIALSSDGGLTYPTILAASTANDGSESVMLPNVSIPNARIKITGIDGSGFHTFFDINDTNIYVAKTTTWTGADPIAPYTWEVSKNWSNGVPGKNDIAAITTGATDIDLNSATSIGGLQIGSAFNGILHVYAPLTLTWNSSWAAGHIFIPSGSSVTNSGTVTLNNASEIRISGGGTWNNNGVMIQSGKGGLAIDDVTTKLVTTKGAVYDFQADSYIESNNATSSYGSFIVQGTLKRSPGVGTGTGIITTKFSITGSISVLSTTLSLAPAFTTGDISNVYVTVLPGATLSFGAATNFSGDISSLSLGTVLMATGPYKFVGDTTISFAGAPLLWTGGDWDLNGKVVTNAGTSSINSAGTTPFHYLSGNGTLVNDGVFTHSSTAGLYINDATTQFYNSSSGLYDLQSNTSITYTGASGKFVSVGTLRRSVATGIAKVECNFDISGALDVQTGTLALACFAAGTGTVHDATATVDKSAVLDLTNGRTVNYSSGLSGKAGANGLGTVTFPGGQINITANAIFNFPDTMFQWTDKAFGGGGTFNISPGMTLINPVGSYMTIDNPGSPVTVTGGGVFSNAGLIRLANIRDIRLNGSGTTLINEPTSLLDVQSTGGVSFSGISGSFFNKGLVRKAVNAGTTIVTTTFTNAGGTIDVQTGTLDLPGTFDLAQGVLQGVGTVLAPVTNGNGSVRPGNSPGKLTINGGYTQSGTGDLKIELNGTVAGASYDQLAVTGTVSLGGTLTPTLGYAAQVNDTFVVINNDGTSDKVTGEFVGLPEGTILPIGSATAQISYKGGDGNDVALKIITAPTGPLPQIPSVQVNDGSAQRSRVTSLLITFNQIVSLPVNPADAFQLKRQSDNAAVTLAASVTNVGHTEVTLTFTGGVVTNSSLADGRYTLTALAAQIAAGTFDGDGNGTGGDNYVLIGDPAIAPRLFRLSGDADGNGLIDGLDFGAFRSAFNSGNPTFDLDGNGVVDGLDFGLFRQRFGVVI